MFKTYVGPVESEDNVAYLRPETAQAIFAQFKNVLETSRQKVPFGIAQIGKAFRNEVTPRNLHLPLARVRADGTGVLHQAGRSGRGHPRPGGDACPRPDIPASRSRTGAGRRGINTGSRSASRFTKASACRGTTLGFHIQKPEELAHYARACTDILFKFPFSKRDEQGELKGEELEGIAARSDFDLSQHARFSGKPMGVFDEELRAAWGKLPKEKQDELWRIATTRTRRKYLTKSGVEAEAAPSRPQEDANGLAKGQYIPHVIEPSAGVDRLILALHLPTPIREAPETDDKGKSETRVVMKFHPRVAPIKVGVLPLLKNKPELVKKALRSARPVAPAHECVLRRRRCDWPPLSRARTKRARRSA